MFRLILLSSGKLVIGTPVFQPKLLYISKLTTVTVSQMENKFLPHNEPITNKTNSIALILKTGCNQARIESGTECYSFPLYTTSFHLPSWRFMSNLC